MKFARSGPSRLSSLEVKTIMWGPFFYLAKTLQFSNHKSGATTVVGRVIDDPLPPPLAQTITVCS